MPDTSIKRCKKCFEEKPSTDFYKQNDNRDGRSGSCKVCEKADRKPRPYTPRANCYVESRRDTRTTLLSMQGGRCAICGSTTSGGNGWHLDHDHLTGVNRGVLCNLCNPMLGMAKDSIEILNAAIAYLKDPPAPHHVETIRKARI